MKDSKYVKINSVNPLYLIVDEVDGYIDQNKRNKYLIIDFRDKNREVLKSILKYAMQLNI